MFSKYNEYCIQLNQILSKFYKKKYINFLKLIKINDKPFFSK